LVGVGLKETQKFPDIGGGAKRDDAESMGMPRQRGEGGLVVHVAEIPDPLDEFPVPFFGTSIRHVGPQGGGTAMPEEDAFGDAPEAAPAREIEVHDGVGALEADLRGAGEIPIHHPARGLDQLIDGAGKLCIGNGSPAGAPIGAVEMNDGQVELLAQRAGEGGFSGSGTADDQVALLWCGEDN
jgi:hypothetical protein